MSFDDSAPYGLKNARWIAMYERRNHLLARLKLYHLGSDMHATAFPGCSADDTHRAALQFAELSEAGLAAAREFATQTVTLPPMSQVPTRPIARVA